MRTYIVLLAILGIAFAKNVLVPRENEDVAKQFIECVRQALDGGLEEAQIPDHNPFIVTRNLTFPIDVTGASGVVKIENGQIDNIVLVHVLDVVGEITDTNSKYTVTFHYDSLLVTGDYVADLTLILFPYHVEGTLSLDLQDTTIVVVWDQDNASRLLNDFTVTLQPRNVDFKITGLGDVTDAAVSESVSLALYELLNNADYSTPSQLLEDRLNTLWLDEEHWYRVEAIMANCQTV